MRKEQSTNSINEKYLFQACELNSALNMISGRWKVQILLCISKGYNRFSLLYKNIPNISEQVLSRQLKVLEKDDLLFRKELSDNVPVGYEYSLTPNANNLLPILQDLCTWGKQNKE